MSIYVNRSKNGNKKYVQIIEATYVKRTDGSSTIKRKVLKNLGSLEKLDDGKPDFLKRLREKFKRGELQIEGLKEIQKERFEKETIVLDKKFAYLEPKNLGYFFINSIFDQLGIAEMLTLEKSRTKLEYDLLGLTRLLVYGRILQSDSKYSTLQQKDKYLFPVTTCNAEKEIYRALDVLYKCSEKIQNRMNLRISQSSIGRITDLTYYDVTNYSFETMYNDEDEIEINQKGETVTKEKDVSKGKKTQPIVQMGLFTDRNGIPITFNLFQGNMQDKTTFKEMIKANVNKFNTDKIIVVSDNGMYTQENFYLLLKSGNGFIISKSIKQAWEKIREHALNEKDYVCFKNRQNEVVFKYKSSIEKRTFKDKNGNSITTKVKRIIYWSKKQYEKNKHDNEKFLECLESCKEHPDKLKDKQRKSQKFVKKYK